MNAIQRLSRLCEENGPKYLYHGTTLVAAAKILRENRLADRTKRTSLTPEPVKGTSMSRVEKIASAFGGAVLVFDRNRIHQDFQVLDVNSIKKKKHWYHYEEEEFVVGEIGNVKRYLAGARLSAEMVKSFKMILDMHKRGVIDSSVIVTGLPDHYTYLANSGLFPGEHRQLLQRIANELPREHFLGFRYP